MAMMGRYVVLQSAMLYSVALLAALALLSLGTKGPGMHAFAQSTTTDATNIHDVVFGMNLTLAPNVWRAVPIPNLHFPGGRIGHTATIYIQDNTPTEARFFVFGGSTPSTVSGDITSTAVAVTNDLWAFHLGFQSWELLSRGYSQATAGSSAPSNVSWPPPRTFHAGEVIYNGNTTTNADRSDLAFGRGDFLVFFGGNGRGGLDFLNLDQTSILLADLWIYDLQTLRWHDLTPGSRDGTWPAPRSTHQFTKCRDDDTVLYMLGGVVPNDDLCPSNVIKCSGRVNETHIVSDLWKLDLSNPTEPVWTLLANDAAFGPRLFTSFVCVNDILYLSGGANTFMFAFNTTAVDDNGFIWTYELGQEEGTGSWLSQPVSIQMADGLDTTTDIAAYLASSVRVGDDSFAVMGGQFTLLTFRRFITIFDTRTMTWTPFPRSRSQEHVSSRIYARGSRLGDSVVLYGGLTLTRFAETIHHFIPQTETVYEVNQHITPDTRLFAGIIPSTREDALYIYGGFDGQLPGGDFWRFDFKTGVWKELIFSNEGLTPRIGVLSVQLTSGTIYVGFGNDGLSALDDLHYFDAETSAFRRATFAILNEAGEDITDSVPKARMLGMQTHIPVPPSQQSIAYPDEAIVFSTTTMTSFLAASNTFSTVYDDLWIIRETRVGHLTITTVPRRPDEPWPDPCILCAFTAFRTSSGRVGAFLFSGTTLSPELVGVPVPTSTFAEVFELSDDAWVYWHDTRTFRRITAPFIQKRFSPGATLSNGLIYLSGGGSFRQPEDILGLGPGDARQEVVVVNVDAFETEEALFDPSASNQTVSRWFQILSTDPQGARSHHILIARNETLFMWAGVGEQGIIDDQSMLVMDLRCGAGLHSTTGSIRDCTPCPVGTYNDDVASEECLPCPAHLSTRDAGSTRLTDCNVCERDFCNGDDCVVDRQFEASCICRFGRAGDRCQVNVLFQVSISLFAGLVFCTALCFTYRKHKRRLHKLQEYHELQEQLLEETKGELLELEQASSIYPHEIEYIRRIDGDSPGAFGQVWLAKFSDVKVAVKQLKHTLDDLPQDMIDEFLAEITFMRRLRHRNIIYFYGAGFEDNKPFLVTEYMARGGLDVVLRKQKHPYKRKLGFLLDAANGMKFLHTLSPPRIHRDLKSANLLVNESWVVKVGDFGTSRLVGGRNKDKQISLMNEANEQTFSSFNMTANVGTLLWSSPEVLDGQDYSLSADVYSFGIVMWEVITQKQPFEELVHIWDVRNAVLNGGRPEVPEGVSDGLQRLMTSCWAHAPSNRPSFTEIVATLEDIVGSHPEEGDGNASAENISSSES